jgi:hypothetical protein
MLHQTSYQNIYRGQDPDPDPKQEFIKKKEKLYHYSTVPVYTV